MIGKKISHYRLLEELDQGGMGVIYKAEDVHLGRLAALKFLPAAMCDDEEVKDRFILEAKAASALDHPNICTIYEIGRSDEGHLFIAMAYYEGETLHKKISRGPLELDAALDYVRQVAAGLAKSHELDIIHRDIKPANIFVTSDDQVKILDFGLAKMLGEGVTLSGLAQGTPAYMAPERIRNEKANPRTDLWSLGVLLHEALAGQRPFLGQSVAEIIQAVHQDPPASLRTSRPETPPELVTIVRKLLRKNPRKRYASCDDLLWDLNELDIGTPYFHRAQRGSGAWRGPSAKRRGATRTGFWHGLPGRISAALVLLLIVGSIGAGLWLLQRQPEAGAASNKLAILLFENISGDPALNWMTHGIPDLLLTDLAQSPQLQVLGSDVVFSHLTGQDLVDNRDPSELARELARRVDVDLMLIGRVAKSGEIPYAEIRLLETSKGHEIFAKTIEIPNQDSVFPRIDDVSLDIRQHLKLPKPGDSDLQVSNITTSSAAAWRFYSTGMEHHLRYEERDAAENFAQAVKLDPNFGMAWAKLATAHRNLGLPDAKDLARQALELSEGLLPRERYYIEGIYLAHDNRTWSRAIAAFNQAVKTDPHFYAARQNLTVAYTFLEQYDEAVRHAEVLSRLEVPYRGSYAALAEGYAALGDLDQAEALLRARVESQPTDFVAHCALGFCLQRSNKLTEAVASFRRAEELEPGSRPSFRGLCTTHLLRQDWAAARSLCDEGRKLGGPLARATDQCETLIALHRGQSASALALINKSIGRTPPGRAQTPLLLSAARVHLDRGEAAQALVQAVKARDAGEGLPFAGQGLFLAAWAEIKLQRWQAARARIAELLELGQLIPDPLMIRQSRHLTGLLALAEERIDDAITELEAAAETLPPRGIRQALHEPDHVPLWASLARAYLRAGNDAGAIEMLTRIEKSTEERVIHPVDYARSLHLLGTLHQRQGNAALARTYSARFQQLWKDGDLAPDELSARFP